MCVCVCVCVEGRWHCRELTKLGAGLCSQSPPALPCSCDSRRGPLPAEGRLPPTPGPRSGWQSFRGPGTGALTHSCVGITASEPGPDFRGSLAQCTGLQGESGLGSLRMPENAGRPLLPGVGPFWKKHLQSVEQRRVQGCRRLVHPGRGCLPERRPWPGSGCSAPPTHPRMPRGSRKGGPGRGISGWTWRSRWVQGTWFCVLSRLSVSTRAGPPPHPTPPYIPHP